MKKTVAAVFFLIFAFLFFPTKVFVPHAQEVTLNQDKVEYNLPYPGILPDHPLFILKKARDKILELTTRDTMKKVELYLLLSDKYFAMAKALATNGKDKQAMITLEQGEIYFTKIPSLIEISRKQGVSPSADLVQRLQLSNEKHKEVAEELLKGLAQGQEETINRVLKLNAEMKKKVGKL